MTDPRTTLQTLDRGLSVLEYLATRPDGATIADIAEATALHRTICTRIASTLLTRHYVYRGTDGRFRLGSAIQVLASRSLPQLTRSALPRLELLARRTGATAHLSVAEGDECVAIMVVEPTDSVLHVTYRIGSRHRLDRGAAGVAILAARSPDPSDPPAVLNARRLGYAHSLGQLQPGADGIAAAITRAVGIEASVGVVSLATLETARIAREVVTAAQQINAHLNA